MVRQAAPALVRHVPPMKFQTRRIEPHACPPRPALTYASSRTKSMTAHQPALIAQVTSILMMETTHVRHVRTDMCKTPPTRTMRPAWFVRTVKDEQVQKPHARIVLSDSLAPAPVFVRHAQVIQYQQAPGTPLAQLAWATERQTSAKHSVSVP